MNNKGKTKEMVQLSLLGALIFILAFTPFIGYIPLGVTRATTIHIPVIIGSILLGPKKGAILGFLFGLTSLITNTVNPTLTSFVFTPFFSIGETSGNFFSLVICFIPRMLIGVFPYYVYTGLNRMKANTSVSLACAGIVGSLTNTLLVMNLIYVFFAETYAQAKEVSVDALYGVILSVIGVNGVPEALVAGILTVFIVQALFKLNKTSRA